MPPRVPSQDCVEIRCTVLRNSTVYMVRDAARVPFSTAANPALLLTRRRLPADAMRAAGPSEGVPALSISREARRSYSGANGAQGLRRAWSRRPPAYHGALGIFTVPKGSLIETDVPDSIDWLYTHAMAKHLGVGATRRTVASGAQNVPVLIAAYFCISAASGRSARVCRCELSQGIGVQSAYNIVRRL